jgi:hypothetical protein
VTHRGERFPRPQLAGSDRNSQSGRYLRV